DDVTGEQVQVSDRPWPTRAEVETTLPAFIGEILQVPPQFSAVHVGGQRAHKMARLGRTVSLEPRPVQIHRITLVRYQYPEPEREIACGPGTYIRSLARDLGNQLGCGALLAALVRRRIGDFSLANSVSIDDLSTRPILELLLPPLVAVADRPRHTLRSG